MHVHVQTHIPGVIYREMRYANTTQNRGMPFMCKRYTDTTTIAWM